MIGVYDYTVILTYGSICASVMGIISSINGKSLYAIIFLMIAGLFDMFDGTVARTKKRTKEEVKFGIQIDSLADVIAFGVLPVVIGYNIGMREWYYIPIFCLFVLGAVIRLAYFNVNEEEVVNKKEGHSRSFIGLPTTSVALILPIVYLFKNMLGPNFKFLYAGFLLLIAFLFVTKFNVIKKPSKRTKILFIILGVIIILVYQGIKVWRLR